MKTENIITRNLETNEVIATYDVSIQHLRNPIADSRKDSTNWQDGSDAWLVTINGQSFEYFTGIGHRVARKHSLKHNSDTCSIWEKLKFPKNIECSEPVTSKFDSVLACLLSDNYADDCSFENWCGEFGYDEDSRKALEIYLVCQSNTKKLRLAKVPIDAEKERLEDY